MNKRKNDRREVWIALAVAAAFVALAVVVWSPWADKQVETAIVKQYDSILEKRMSLRDSIPGAGVHDHSNDWMLLDEARPPDTIRVDGDTIPLAPYFDRNDFDDHAHYGMSGDEVRDEIGNWVTALLEWSQGIVTGLGAWIGLYVMWRRQKRGDVPRETSEVAG